MSQLLRRFVSISDRRTPVCPSRLTPGGSCLALCLAVAAATAWPSPASSAQPKWQVAGHDCELQVLQHTRLDGSQRLPACDHFQLHAGPGTHAYAVWPLPPSTVIAELDIRVPIRSTQALPQLLVRVVLPRSLHDDGYPFSILLAGSVSDRPGGWQTLRLENITQKLQEQVRILRSSAGSNPIDPREAYVDLIVVNVYGGPGTSETWLRDPLVEGLVSVGDHVRSTQILPASFALPGKNPQRANTDIQLTGDLLKVNGRPFFPRVIEANGESWQSLKRLGFNTIRLAAPATADQILRAEQLDLWLMAPPPKNWPGADLNQHFRRILAWDLGVTTSRQNLDEIRRVDRRRNRPVVSESRGDSTSLLPADIQLNRRETLGSNLSDRQYHEWILSRSQVSGPGTPHWCTVQIEPLRAVQEQLAELGYADQAAALQVDPIDLQKSALLAAVSGMRGLVFTSRQRLDADSPQARLRATTLQRLNLRLDLIEPWLSGRDTHRPRFLFR